MEYNIAYVKPALSDKQHYAVMYSPVKTPYFTSTDTPTSLTVIYDPYRSVASATDVVAVAYIPGNDPPQTPPTSVGHCCMPTSCGMCTMDKQ